MAAVDVLPVPVEIRPSFETPIQYQKLASLCPSEDDFDPQKHLAFVPPSRIYTMQDILLPEDTGVSSFAVSEPFQLFTEEAVLRMRAEILSKEVWDNCQYSSNLAHCQLRGFAPKSGFLNSLLHMTRETLTLTDMLPLSMTCGKIPRSSQ